MSVHECAICIDKYERHMTHLRILLTQMKHTYKCKLSCLIGNRMKNDS